MKKIITVSIALGIAISSYATHLMGGQIVATYLSSDTTGSHYALDLTAYRDTIGIPMGISANFHVSVMDTSGNWNVLFSSTVSYDTTSGGLFLPVQSAYGVEVYTYHDTITLPANGYYKISYSECCRNGAIINMSSPLNENMVLATYINVDSASPNSSPSYLTPPVSYLPAHTLWSYNPLPFDPDGDSLTWSLATPLSGGGSNTYPVNGYEYLSDTLYSDSAGVFSLDSITGSLSWQAKMAGNFVASFIIEEYRNGVKIGEMRRDMQFIVTPDTSNSMPQISNMQSVPTNSGGYPYVKIYPGQNYQLHLLANDADPNDVLSMITYGEAFSLNLSPALFSYNTTGNGNEIEGIFSWTPDITHVRKAPYLTVFRTSDNMFYYDETIQFEVALSTDINELSDFSLEEIYPNPATNRIYIPINITEKQSIILDVYNILGSKVSNSDELSLQAGNHILIKNLNLKQGQYFVSIRNKEGMVISTRKILVTY